MNIMQTVLHAVERPNSTTENLMTFLVNESYLNTFTINLNFHNYIIFKI